MNESFVQRKIIETHQKRGWLCVKLLQTTCNGICDLMLLKNGRTVFVEVKRPGVKTAEPLQLYRHRQLRDLGFEVHLTDDPKFSVNDVREVKKKIDYKLIAEPVEWEMPVMSMVSEEMKEKVIKKMNAKKKNNAK